MNTAESATTKSPFIRLWEKYDEKYAKDIEKHKDDYSYRSHYAPLMTEKGTITNDKSANINLSSIASLLIENIGRFCERYASDFLIDWKRVEEAIRVMNPYAKPVYIWLGLRRNGVDSESFIASRITESSSYYRRVYSIRVTYDAPDYGAISNIKVELRDMTHDMYEIAKYYKNNDYEYEEDTPFNHMTPDEQKYKILEELLEIRQLSNKINERIETIRESNPKNPEWRAIIDDYLKYNTNPYSVLSEIH